MKAFFKSFLVSAILTLGISTAWAGHPHGFNPTRYITVNGVKVAAYESRGHKLPGVLLIHGNTSSAQSYEKILNSDFARHRRVVAIDLPGYGRSENSPSYDITTFTSAVVQSAQALNLADGIIVGWSLGGDIVLQASSQLPNAKGFFIFGTAPVGNSAGLPPPFLAASESYAGAAVNYGVVGNLTSTQIADYVTAFFRPHYHTIPNFFYQAGNRTDPGTRAAVLVAATGQDPHFQDEVQIVRNFPVPLAVVIGSKDAFVRQEFLTELAPTIQNLYREQIVTVNGSGHAIHWEKPEKFIKLLRQFVKDVE